MSNIKCTIKSATVGSGFRVTLSRRIKGEDKTSFSAAAEHVGDPGGGSQVVSVDKTAQLLLLLVVLQVSQDPTRGAEDGEGQQAQSDSCFLDMTDRD